MERTKSVTINYLRFIFTLAVVTLHAYTVTRTVKWLSIDHPVYEFLSYNLSMIIGYIAVPFFFFISGYLFYINGKPKYLKKLKSRFFSLVVPYVLWNMITIILFYILQSISYTEGFFSGANKAITAYTFKDFLLAFWDCGEWNLGNGEPILVTYWYIRNLIILVIASPIIYWLNTYLKFYWLIIAGIVWLLTPHVAFSATSIFCFGLGAYFGTRQMDLQLSDKMYKGMLVLLGVLTVVLNFFFYHQEYFTVSVAISRLFTICFVPVIYTMVYKKVDKCRWRIPGKWLDSAFFVYSFHFFVMMGVRKFVVKVFPDASDALSVFFYLSSVVITFFVSYGVYALLRKYVPKVLAVMCGDRC